MDKNIIEGKWKQLRGTITIWLGYLQRDQFIIFAGQQDRLNGKVQVWYGSRAKIKKRPASLSVVMRTARKA